MSYVRRAFSDISLGQIHYRYSGLENSHVRPLIMLHGEPASSYVLEPLIKELGRHRPVYAPDTLGTGDSSPLQSSTIEVDDLAEISFSFITSIGIEDFDLYGTYTGGHIATELSLSHKENINSLILDEAGLIPEEIIPDLISNYVPDISIDTHGNQFFRLFQWVRDQYIYFPWYARDKKHWRNMDMPPAEVLFHKTMEVLKGKDSMPIIFSAVFRHDLKSALKKINVPTLATHEEVKLVPNANLLDLPFHEAVSANNEYVKRKSNLINSFLDKHK